MSYFACEGLCKSYSGRQIIRDISLHVEKGELVSLLGVSGIGKTTLFNLLSGLEAPDGGRVFYEGREVTGQKGMVGYMQQKDLLLPFKTVLDNICLPLVIRGERKADARRQAEQHLKFFGLEGMGGKYPSQLSGGQRQRAALLRTYLFSGQMLLLDEPFSALDAITKSAIHDWYLDMVRQMEASTLLITHDIDEAVQLSARIYIMSGAPGQITHELALDFSGSRKMDFTLSEQFIHYKMEILSHIQGT